MLVSILSYLKNKFTKPQLKEIFVEESPLYEIYGFQSGFYNVRNLPNIFIYLTVHRGVLIRNKHVIVYDIDQDCIIKKYDVPMHGWIDPDFSEVEKECKMYEDIVSVDDYDHKRLQNFLRKISDINVNFAVDIKFLLLTKFKEKLLNSKGYLKFKNTYIKYKKCTNGEYSVKLLDKLTQRYVEFNYESEFEFLFENFYMLDLCDCPIGDIDE